MIILKNASIVKAENLTEKADIIIEGGVIKEIAPYDPDSDRSSGGGTKVIDCEGRLLMPGFIDAHVHLREPGFERKETVKTGSLAAAAGGFTTIMPMPNLKPVPDSPEVMRDYMELLKSDGMVNIFPYASITKGEKGQELTDMKALMRIGAAAFSDDGVGVQSDEMMRSAMKQAVECGTIIVAHTEDNTLKNSGYVHQGAYAEKMGWRGIPSACESAQAGRDIILAEETGCRYHICHVSAKETIDLVREAKKKGLKVTCEITPHHLTLIDEDVKDANDKMNPPLRAADDREALIQAIKDGTADIIATDHAPHTADEKSAGIERAPFGIVGLETAFPVLYTDLVKPGVLTLERLQQVMSEKPAEIFGFEGRGRIAEGYQADLVLIDRDCEYSIDPESFKSKGRNTPYTGKKVSGKILWTMVGGSIIYND